MRVAVLGGGRSGEHEVSLGSAEAVRSGLAAAGHEVVDVRLARDGTWTVEGEDVRLEPGRGLLGCDVAWPVLHGPYGEDGTVQGVLELLDVPYVGAGVLASALCMDKVLFKDVLAAAGVGQVDYRAVRRDGPVDLGRLGYPLFVKPARLGSSVGIAKVRGPGDLDAALEGAFAHDSLVIAEGFSGGMEVECAVLGGAASELGEIVLPDAEWYDYEAKYSEGGMELVVPARIPGAVADEVRRLALETFARVGCRGLARVDFFVEEVPGGHRVLVNELNTMPGFTRTSVYPKLWEASGVGFTELCDRLLSLAG
jgi:D-alanine-D-alanine ligase